jgi:predicted NBD/HSP70 family sugar kinase
MPTTQREAQHTEPGAEGRHAAIRGRVMHALGQPGGLHSVQVRPLWGDYYRVNVFVGVDAASARVAHSYFLVADGHGNVLEATPEIIRQY